MPIVKDGLIFCCNLKYVAPHLSIPDRSERWATVGIAISWLVDIGWLVGWYSHWLVGPRQLLGVELENNSAQGHKCCTLSR